MRVVRKIENFSKLVLFSYSGYNVYMHLQPPRGNIGINQ